MGLIQELLSKLLWLIIAIAILVGLFFVLQKFQPNFLKKFNLAATGSFFTDNWLPDPVNFQEVNKPKTADLSNNIYEGNMTPGMAYVIYDDQGMHIVNVPLKNGDKVFNAQTAGYYDNSLYVRNLSVVKNESIRTGMTFYGEARNTFFADGRFPIYILNSQGKSFTRELAVATGQWSVPGWVRFSFTVSSLLPAQEACTLLFTPDPNSLERNSPHSVMIPVRCN